MDDKGKRKHIKLSNADLEQDSTNCKEGYSVNCNDDVHAMATDLFQESILSNLLVTDRIFKHLTKADLLNCSLTSKKFNKSSRDYLPKHHPCPIMFNRMLGISDLQQLIVLLDNTILNRNYPFTGVHFLFSDTSTLFKNSMCYEIFNQMPQMQGSSSFALPSKVQQRKEIQEVHDLLAKIFERIPAKHFFLYTQRLLNSFGLLERFETIPFTKVENIKTNVGFDKFADAMVCVDGALEFTILNRVCFKPHNFQLIHADLIATRINLLTDFLTVCPVLRNWSSPVFHFEVKAFVKANKPEVIKSLKIVSRLSSEDIEEIDDAGLVLWELDVDDIECGSDLFVEYEEFVQFVVHLLRNSVSTLQVFLCGIECISAIVNSALAFPPLKNCRHVKISRRDVQNQFSNLLRLFPNACIEYLD